MTAEETWEIAKKISLCPIHGGFDATELKEIFGRIEDLWELSPQEAKGKIEAWEAEKEIKVGDVVRADSTKAAILNIHDEYLDVLVEDGCAEEWYKSKVTKTGCHIDIQGLLKQIGGAE